MNEKTKLLVILGPTSSGKSDLAVELAKKYNGEIISADSRQVYKSLNIGTGKITPQEMDGITHHLLDVIEPEETFTVQDFKDQAEVAIKDILSRKKLPLLCGGTGFYIDTVVNGMLLPDVPRNAELRLYLEQKPAEWLFKELEKVDQERAIAIGPHNRPRLVRALEISQALGKVPPVQTKVDTFNVLKIGIQTPLLELQQKILARLLKRLESGMLDEAKRLLAQGMSYERMFALGLEYRYMSLYLQEKISYEEMLERLTIETFQYAKRQLQWWKKDTSIIWLSLKQKETMIPVIETWLSC